MVTDVILPITLFLMMTSMGMSLLVEDFKQVAQSPKAAIVGAVSMLLLLPVLGFVFATYSSLSPTLAVGLVLVATCPGGMFSNLLTHMGHGNLALSVSLTAVVSMVYVFTIPLWCALALRTFMGDAGAIEIAWHQTLLPLASVVLAPIAIGMLIRKRYEAFALRWEGVFKTIATLGVLAIFVATSMQQTDTIADDSSSLFLPVLLLNVASVTLAGVLALLARFERRDAIALMIEHGVRQEGTAILVAVSIVGSAEMALPLMLNAGIGLAISFVLLLLIGGKVPLVTRLRGLTS
jgi:bile acid:Na+ symporter, BASS family